MGRLPVPRTVFPHLGGKGGLAPLLPSPLCRLIVEPFGGAAAYSFLHHAGHDVWVNELNPCTYSIWEFLQWTDAFRVIQSDWPKSVRIGQHLDALVTNPAHPGFLELVRAYINLGTYGMTGVRQVVTKDAAGHWSQYKPRFTVILPIVARWKITNLDYRQLDDVDGCWLIDPPYNNVAGRKYEFKLPPEAYPQLAEWCLNRRGHLLVTEQTGSPWLPFRPLTNRRMGFTSLYKKDPRGDVYYERLPQSLIEGPLADLTF